MKCPFCKHDNTRALETRQLDGFVRRRRQCSNPACEKRFTTQEVVLLKMHSLYRSIKQLRQRGFTVAACADILQCDESTVWGLLKVQPGSEEPQPAQTTRRVAPEPPTMQARVAAADPFNRNQF